jgi:L-iditol 2-dehydrogenase
VHGFEDSNPHPGDTVAVIGGGPLGLMMTHVAALAGCEVIAIVRHDGQAEAARQLGAAHVVKAPTIRKAIQEARAFTPKERGVDIAIEAVGKPQTWEWAVNMVRRGGTVNFFGGCPNDSSVRLDTSLLHYSEITCKASFHHTPAYIQKALELVCAGHITAGFFVNREEPLTNLLEVMRHLMSHNGHLKTAIVP